MFFYRDGKVSAAFYRGIISHDNDFGPMYAANASNDAGAGRLIIKHAMSGERR